jgi:hypothetical protein
MPLWPVIIGAVVLFIACSLIPGIRHRRFRRSIYQRPSAQAEWAETFPDAAPVVEQVLKIFCNAFLFNERYRFHFRPGDQILDVYKGTTGPVADSLEMEILAFYLADAFGVDFLAHFTQSTTLRDVVALAVGKRYNYEQTFVRRSNDEAAFGHRAIRWLLGHLCRRWRVRLAVFCLVKPDVLQELADHRVVRSPNTCQMRGGKVSAPLDHRKTRL